MGMMFLKHSALPGAEEVLSEHIIMGMGMGTDRMELCGRSIGVQLTPSSWGNGLHFLETPRVQSSVTQGRKAGNSG